MNKIVAIHQPNFFPWLGFFDKIYRSDKFILLDNVQYPKKGGTWSNRVMLLVAGKNHWYTAPIIRTYHGYRTISEIEFQHNNPWRDKLIKTLIVNYSKAPFYEETISFLISLILYEENNLSIYNNNTILKIAEKIGISSTKFLWSSNLSFIGQSNEMLISLTKMVGGDTYMCGGGADGYQNEKIFKELGIKLIHQQFQHPCYHQIGADEFVPGLSIIDAVFHLGWDGVRNLFKFQI